MYDVITVRSPQEWKQFHDVQRLIYSRQSHAIPLPAFEVQRLLDGKRNPALRERKLYPLVVRRGGEPVGRCSLLLPGNGGAAPALFGFFECVNDQRAADALLYFAEAICIQQGAGALHGPFSPTTSGLTGIQLDRFDDANVLGEPCSPPYYATLLASSGYGIEQKGRTWRSATLRRDMDILAVRLSSRPTRFRLESIRPRDLDTGVADLAAIYDDAFQENWSREPMAQDEYFYSARYLLPAWIRDGLAVAYDETRAVGAVLCMADINPAFRTAHRWPRALSLLRAKRLACRTRTLVAFAIGMLPEYQNSAAMLPIVRHLTDVARRYERMYTTWITEGNRASERMCIRFGLRPWRTLGVFRKEL